MVGTPPTAQPGDHYREIYLKGLGGERPQLPVAWAELEAAAAAALDERARAYVFGSAGSEDTERENRAGFRARRIVPRALVDVAVRDLRCAPAGIKLAAPLAIAPIGVQGILHPDGELATARAAAELGVAMCASTVASHSLEQIAAALGDSPKLFQLYWPNDFELAESLVRRAEAAGYDAIIVTVDNAFPGWKPRDLQQAWLPFLEGQGLANYFADPVFCEPLAASPAEDPGAAIGRFLGVFTNPSLSWDDLGRLREWTNLPILLKGILDERDAALAIDAGIDGIVVSNHGGRQVDGAVAAIDALGPIAELVDGRAAILFDSGIRSGADAFKALALGAEAVLIGRPILWGLALAGQSGVETVLKRMLAEFDLTVGLSGHTAAGQIGPDSLREASGR